MEQFVAASRMKVRFETTKGLLSVEDLWDLTLDRGRVNLDEIAIALSREVKGDSESFVHKSKTINTELTVKLDVVVHIIEVRLKELEEAKVARLRVEKKGQILEIIARKENKDLEEKSLDELKGLLANL